MKKILLVEDDQFLRTLYHDLLKNEDYQVETAVDGEEALKKIQIGGWDLILLDIVIPKLDGIQVVKTLKRESPQSIKQNIIFLTNLDKNEMMKEIDQMGFKYLIKSDLTPEDFVNKIKSLI